MSKIILIAALNERNVIGNNSGIPWHIPDDLKRFRRITTGHTVVMGRKTFYSIGAPLPDRRNIVISRDPSIVIPHVTIHSSIDSAIDSASAEEKLFIIGGGEIFRQTIGLADELLLTVVDNHDEGDTVFPDFQSTAGNPFILVHSEQHSGYRFDSYKKNRS